MDNHQTTQIACSHSELLELHLMTTGLEEITETVDTHGRTTNAALTYVEEKDSMHNVGRACKNRNPRGTLRIPLSPRFANSSPNHLFQADSPVRRLIGHIDCGLSQ